MADRKEGNLDVVGTSQWQNTQGFIINCVVLGGEEEDSRLTQGVFLGDLASRNLIFPTGLRQTLQGCSTLFTTLSDRQEHLLVRQAFVGMHYSGVWEGSAGH